MADQDSPTKTVGALLTLWRGGILTLLVVATICLWDIWSETRASRAARATTAVRLGVIERVVLAPLPPSEIAQIRAEVRESLRGVDPTLVIP